jgi:hypothetical protein
MFRRRRAAAADDSDLWGGHYASKRVPAGFNPVTDYSEIQVTGAQSRVFVAG